MENKDVVHRMRRLAYVDYQASAYEYNVGDVVTWIGRGQESAGRVVHVWERIGQLDVQFPSGCFRVDVRDMQKLGENAWIDPPNTNDMAVNQTYVPSRSRDMGRNDNGHITRQAPARVNRRISPYAEYLELLGKQILNVAEKLEVSEDDAEVVMVELEKEQV